MIRSTLLAAAAIALSSAAIADEAKGPRMMTDQELSATVAGSVLVVGPSGHIEPFGAITVSNFSGNSNDEKTSGVYVGWPNAENGLVEAAANSDALSYNTQ